MTLDFVLREARLAGRETEAVDIGVRGGRIAAKAITISTVGVPPKITGMRSSASMSPAKYALSAAP